MFLTIDEFSTRSASFRRISGQLKDIEKIPFIDKNIYRDNIGDMVLKKYRRKFLPTVFTGGTTGTPLMLYRNYSDYGRERAYTEFAYQALGMGPRRKKQSICAGR